MRLVFLHGINQQGRGEAELRQAWARALASGSSPFAYSQDDVVLPFYGDALAGSTDSEGAAVRQGPGSPDADETAFLGAALLEQAQAAGLDAAAIAARGRRSTGEVPEAVAQGVPMDRRVNAIVAALEGVSPFHGDLALRLLRQAYAYLKEPRTTAAVDAIARPAIEAGPAIVVAHSLGTIVGFKLLRQLATSGRPVRVPLLVTMGSPLSLRTVQRALGPSFAKPEGVDHWLNAVDRDDFIALGRGLDTSLFSGGVDNVLDVAHTAHDAHALWTYLGDRRVAGAIAAAWAPYGR